MRYNPITTIIIGIKCLPLIDVLSMKKDKKGVNITASDIKNPALVAEVKRRPYTPQAKEIEVKADITMLGNISELFNFLITLLPKNTINKAKEIKYLKARKYKGVISSALILIKELPSPQKIH